MGKLQKVFDYGCCQIKNDDKQQYDELYFFFFCEITPYIFDGHNI